MGALAEALAALADDEPMLERAQAAGLERAREMDWSHARARLDEVLGALTPGRQGAG
ncbi:hypothetical protein NKG05_19780 [Oerskovia sp. M15]